MPRRSKKTSSKELSAHPDYEKLTTIDEIDAEILKHKEILVSKDLVERRIKDERKSFVSALNEQLKEIGEEREHEMGILDALGDRKRQVSALSQTPVIPIRARTT